MTEDRPKWATGLNTSEHAIARFESIARDLKISSQDLISSMIEQVIQKDEHLLEHSRSAGTDETPRILQ
jgi:hypothetical protein